MAKITLEYDEKNKAAKKILEGILATDFFSVGSKKEKANGKTLKAVKDVENGDVIKYKSFEDFKKHVLCIK